MLKRNFKEARDGNFNAKSRTRVLKFLKGLGRDDIFILDKESSLGVVWTVDCGRVDLVFTFFGALDSYKITAKDSNKETIETWSGEYGELQADLEDTVDFIEEFKGSLNAAASPKTESVKLARRLRVAEAKLKIAKKNLQEVYSSATAINSLKATVTEQYPEYVDLIEPYLEEIRTIGEPGESDDLLSDFLDYAKYILGPYAG